MDATGIHSYLSYQVNPTEAIAANVGLRGKLNKQ
jgi:hypothetical protein